VFKFTLQKDPIADATNGGLAGASIGKHANKLNVLRAIDGRKKKAATNALANRRSPMPALMLGDLDNFNKAASKARRTANMATGTNRYTNTRCIASGIEPLVL
jgi:hypothetical protein